MLVMAGLIGCDRQPPTNAVGPVGVVEKTEAGAETVEARVHRIVAEQFGIRASEVKDSLRFTEDLKADELDNVELVMECEDTFKITISDADADRIKTVGELIAYVKKQPARGGGNAPDR